MNMHEGHRKRMMEKLEKAGESLQDHELLEILLYYVLPRCDTNPSAHRLIDAFGTLHGVLHADVEQLCEVTGIGRAAAGYLHCLGLTLDRIHTRNDRLPQYKNPGQFKEYLLKHFGEFQNEFLEFYCLDESGKAYYFKSYTNESDVMASVEPSEVSRIIVTQRPHSIIVAHNHPDKGCFPSRNDDVFTQKIYAICLLNNINLRDHFIYGKDGYFSYCMSGRMTKIKEECEKLFLRDGSSLL